MTVAAEAILAVFVVALVVTDMTPMRISRYMESRARAHTRGRTTRR